MAELSWTVRPAHELERHADLWNGFITSEGWPPFLRVEFLAPALAVFGCDDGRVLFGRDSTKLVAVALVTRVGFGRWATFQPSQLPLGAAAITATYRWRDVLPSMLRALPGFALSLSLTQQDPKRVERPESVRGMQVDDYVPTSWIDVTGAFAAFWEARGKNLRQNSRKQRRKLEEQGSRLTFEFLETPAQVQHALGDFMQLESMGWKAAQGTAIQADNAQGRFYSEMLNRFGQIDSAFAFRLLLDGRAIAVDFGLRAGTVLVLLKTTYDETLKGLSPGQLLHEQAFEYIFQHYNPSCIEFYGKIMEWHTRWSEQSRMLYHITYDRMPLLRKIYQGLKPAPAVAEASS